MAGSSGLGPSGRALWRRVTTDYQLNPAERALLTEACRTVDTLPRLQAEADSLDDLTVRGSRGQPVASPVLVEMRQQRRVLAQLVRACRLPGSEAAGSEAAGNVSVSAREMAHRRWDR